MDKDWSDTIPGAVGLDGDPSLADAAHKRLTGTSDSDGGVLDELGEAIVNGVIDAAGNAVSAVVDVAGELLSGLFD